MSNQTREINNLHERGNPAYALQPTDLRLFFQMFLVWGQKKKEKKFEIMRNNG